MNNNRANLKFWHIIYEIQRVIITWNDILWINSLVWFVNLKIYIKLNEYEYQRSNVVFLSISFSEIIEQLVPSNIRKNGVFLQLHAIVSRKFYEDSVFQITYANAVTLYSENYSRLDYNRHVTRKKSHLRPNSSVVGKNSLNI